MHTDHKGKQHYTSKVWRQTFKVKVELVTSRLQTDAVDAVSETQFRKTHRFPLI